MRRSRSPAARGAIVELLPAEFDYSTSLNLGIEGARGEFVVSLSAHAIPPTTVGSSADRPVPDAGGGRRAGRHVRGPTRRGRRSNGWSTVRRYELHARAGERRSFSSAMPPRHSPKRLAGTSVHASGSRGSRLGTAGRRGRLVDRVRAANGRLPLAPREPARPGATADRHQPRHRRRQADARCARCARPLAMSSATRSRFFTLTTRCAASCLLSPSSRNRVFYVIDFSRAGTTAEGAARTPPG